MLYSHPKMSTKGYFTGRCRGLGSSVVTRILLFGFKNFLAVSSERTESHSDL